MKNDVVPVQVRGILPANNGVAIFIGNAEKVFVIQVETSMGRVISNFLRKTPNERPLTHDLIGSIFKGFGINLERVVISELRNATYFARLILKEENELGVKLVEIDARPSDCIALAVARPCCASLRPRLLPFGPRLRAVPSRLLELRRPADQLLGRLAVAVGVARPCGAVRPGLLCFRP